MEDVALQIRVDAEQTPTVISVRGTQNLATAVAHGDPMQRDDRGLLRNREVFDIGI